MFPNYYIYICIIFEPNTYILSEVNLWWISPICWLRASAWSSCFALLATSIGLSLGMHSVVHGLCVIRELSLELLLNCIAACEYQNYIYILLHVNIINIISLFCDISVYIYIYILYIIYIWLNYQTQRATVFAQDGQLCLPCIIMHMFQNPWNTVKDLSIIYLKSYIFDNPMWILIYIYIINSTL